MSDIRFDSIRPPKFDDKFYSKPLFFAMAQFGDEVLSEYKFIARAWKSHEPKFVRILNTGGKGGTTITVSISTENMVFWYLDRGVEGHLIYPRKDHVSGTSGTYESATLPGTLSIIPGGGHKVLDGNYLNLNQVIDWPGIEARDFSGLIREKVESNGLLSERLQDVLNNSAAGAWKK